MRHNKKFNHLGRTNTHRDAMLSNMACSLIKHKRIFTTTAKAKALRKYVEPLITKSKEDTTHSRRVVFSNLQDKFAVTELFKEIAQKIGDRPGGYMLKDTAAKKAPKTRRSRKKATASVAEAPTAEAASEEKAAE